MNGCRVSRLHPSPIRRLAANLRSPTNIELTVLFRLDHEREWSPIRWPVNTL
jgi:hypothetical protein